jgi:hypothetical protein
MLVGGLRPYADVIEAGASLIYSNLDVSTPLVDLLVSA